MTEEDFVAAVNEREQKDREHTAEFMVFVMANLHVASKPMLFHALETHEHWTPAIWLGELDHHLRLHAEVRRLADEGTG